MSEEIKKATREGYGDGLVEIGKEFDNLVVLDADLAEATKTCVFKKEFPERHIDCGIAECNMMGVAAGLPLPEKYRLPAPLQCFRQAGLLNRFAIPSDILI